MSRERELLQRALYLLHTGYEGFDVWYQNPDKKVILRLIECDYQPITSPIDEAESPAVTGLEPEK